ncbi:MAPEG family protein [Sphingomonas sp. MMS24-JH45]
MPTRLKGVAVGDGGDPRMMAMTRAHANFAEYAPTVLILLAAIELSGGSATWLWIAGAVFVLGRVAHALGAVPQAGAQSAARGRHPHHLGGRGAAGGMGADLAYAAYGAAQPVAIDAVPVEAPRGCPQFASVRPSSRRAVGPIAPRDGAARLRRDKRLIGYGLSGRDAARATR